MEQEKFIMTQTGFDNLVKELDRLVNEERPLVIRELAEARAQGDLSENADYDAAREKQAQLESQIQRYQHMIDHVEIISSGNVEKVDVGVTVTYIDLSDNTTEEVQIVGTFESNPFIGKISNDCPLAKALMEHREGDTVLIPMEDPYEVLITKIEIKDATEGLLN